MHLTRKLAIQSVLLASAVSWAGWLSTAAWAQVVAPGGAGSMTPGTTSGFSGAVPATAAPAAAQTTGTNAANLPGLPGRAPGNLGASFGAAPPSTGADTFAPPGFAKPPVTNQTTADGKALQMPNASPSTPKPNSNASSSALQAKRSNCTATSCLPTPPTSVRYRLRRYLPATSSGRVTNWWCRSMAWPT